MSYPYLEPPYGYASPGALPGVPPIYHSHQPYPYPIYGHDIGMYGPSNAQAEAEGKSYWRYAAPHPPQVEYYLSPGARFPAYPPLATPSSGLPISRHVPDMSPADRTAALSSEAYSERHVPATPGGETGDFSQGSPRTPGAKNMLDIVSIENGTDTRTTVMIKNIPNKMTDKDLKNFIDRVCPRRIDFMYLRMDFQNG